MNLPQVTSLPSNYYNLHGTSMQTGNNAFLKSSGSSPNLKDLKINLNKGQLAKMDVSLCPLLNKLTLQEEYIRKSRSVPKKEKAIPAYQIKNKLKQLMSNITNTLNDMDLYFSLDQLKNKTSPNNIVNKKRRKAYEVNNKVDEKMADDFLDSFIKQMYRINPLIINKVRSRIDEEFSSIKRQVRLAKITPNTDDKIASLYEQTSDLKSNPTGIHKSDDKDEQLEETIYPYEDDDLDYDNDEYSELDFEDSSLTNIDNDKDDTHRATVLLSTSTSTVSTTTSEAFYDYGDYYKESYGNVKDISEYDINRNDDEEPSTAKSKK